jgi:hypothetical protein
VKAGTFRNRLIDYWQCSELEVFRSTAGERKMLKSIIILSLCLAASSLSLQARAQDTEGAYTEGPVVQVTYIHVEYGKLAEYVDWLNSTWKPTLEAMRKAGLVIDYKVFRASPKTLDQPNIFIMITFKDMAALDRRTELEAVANKVIGSTEAQNNARVARTDYRKLLGSELIRELILK